MDVPVRVFATFRDIIDPMGYVQVKLQEGHDIGFLLKTLEEDYGKRFLHADRVLTACSLQTISRKRGF